MPSGIGSTPSALAESGAHTGQIEPRSGQVLLKQCSLRGVNAQSADGSENLGDLWRGRGRTLRLMKQLSLPDLSFEGRGCVAPRMAQPPPLRIPPDCPDSAGYQVNQGAGHKDLFVAPLRKNQPWLSELTQLLIAALWPIALRRDLLSHANGTILHPRPDLWSLHLWPLDGSP